MRIKNHKYIRKTNSYFESLTNNKLCHEAFKSADELYKFVSDYFMSNNKHNLIEKNFIIGSLSMRQRLSKGSANSNQTVNGRTGSYEVKNHAFDEEQYHRKFDSFFYRTILRRVGEIIGVKGSDNLRHLTVSRIQLQTLRIL